jgi:peptidoglycan/LPS O-acetylase OafA/YrhL
MKYYSGLDTLRAFAVIFVIITHWGPHTINASKALTFFLTRVLPDGEFGVDLFFVLSGYLITGILLKARDESAGQSKMQVLKAFYIRRMLRIFPAYLLLIAVAYWNSEPSVRGHLFYFLTYTSNFLVFESKSWSGVSHTWSLAVEEQFYLIWPWIILYSPKKYLKAIFKASFFTGLLSSVLLQHFYGAFSSVLTLPCITAFATGALYAYAQTEPELERRAASIFLRLLPLCIVFYFFHQYGAQFSFKRVFNAVIAVCAIIYVVKGRYNQITRYVLTNKVFISIGKVSYGIYLYHYIIPGMYYTWIDRLYQYRHFNFGVYQYLKNPPVSYIIHLAITLVLSYLSYYLIENNINKFKSNFPYVNLDRPVRKVAFNG